MSSQTGRVTKYAVLLGVLWALCIALIWTWSYVELHKTTHQLALNEARANLNKDVAFRLWGASHGGVYVPPTERTPSNPDLWYLSDRDVVTEDGKRLTLMNPAYMLRQMMDEYSDFYGIKGHMTSLKPLRPANAPDGWEQAALKRFEAGEKEVLEYSEIGDESYLRYMQPLYVTEDCLKCHGHQQYKLGDVRGGLSLSVPMNHLLALEKQNVRKLTFTHLMVIVIGFLGIWVSRNNINAGISRHESAQEAIRAKERLLSRIAENFPNSYVSIIERDMTVGFTSGQEFKHQNLDPSQFVGMHLKDVFGEHYPVIRENYLRAFNGEEVTFELFVNNQNQFYHVVPLYENDGGVKRILAVVENITGRKAAEVALKKRDAQLNEAQSIARIGCWELDLDNDALFWSDEIYRIFEMDPEVFGASYKSFMERVHPADRSKVDHAYTDSLNNRANYDIEHRLLMPDGRIKYVHERCNTHFDADGKPLRSVGTVQDITARKVTEEALAKTEAEWTHAMDFFDDAIYLIDMDDRVVRANRAFYELTRLAPENVLGKDISSIMHPGGEETLCSVCRARKERRDAIITMENDDPLNPTGRPMEVRVSMIRDSAGEPMGVLMGIHDLTKYRHAEEQIRNSLKEKEFLLKEIHHRVKNNMAIIASLITLQSNYARDEFDRDLFDESRQRIKSMALIHDMLYQSEDFVNIDFVAYIEGLFKSVLNMFDIDPGDISIVTDIEKVSISINDAIPCSLIINELMTNAIKHSFASTGRGEIRVSIKGVEQGKIRIIFSDNGVGLPEGFDITDTCTMGMLIINSLVDQLEGQIEAGSADGAQFIITF